MEYEFRDLLKADDVELEQQINEGFTFGGFDTTKHGWFLVDRSAPTPNEKELTESVPYMNGSFDFSIFNDERYFDNRELSYKFIMPSDEYINRKSMEQELKRKLVPLQQQALYDTHDNGYHWMAKVKSIEVEDDSQYNKLTASVVFDAYPFAIINDTEGADIWDDVYFPHWIFQKTKYDVNGSMSIDLYNMGSKVVSPKMIVTGNVTVSKGSLSMDLTDGSYEDTKLVLIKNHNNIVLSGKGTIEFKYNREEMI